MLTNAPTQLDGRHAATCWGQARASVVQAKPFARKQQFKQFKEVANGNKTHRDSICKAAAELMGRAKAGQRPSESRVLRRVRIRETYWLTGTSETERLFTVSGCKMRQDTVEVRPGETTSIFMEMVFGAALRFNQFVVTAVYDRIRVLQILAQNSECHQGDYQLRFKSADHANTPGGNPCPNCCLLPMILEEVGSARILSHAQMCQRHPIPR